MSSKAVPLPDDIECPRRDDLLIQRGEGFTEWRTPGDANWYRCRATHGMVYFQSSHYHPAYDEEPWTWEESISPAVFLGGREQERACRELGRPALDDVIAEVRSLNPGIEPLTAAQLSKAERRGARRALREPSWAGFLAGIAVAGVVGFLLFRCTTRIGEWFERRASGAPQAVVAIVRNPHVSRVTHTLPKGRDLRSEEVWITLEYESAGATRLRPLRVKSFPEFQTAEAERWLRDHYRDGDRTEAWILPLRPDEPALATGDLMPGVAWLILDLVLAGFGLLIMAFAGQLILRTRP